MCGSAVQGKAEIKNWVSSRKDIKTIVDVGCGSATYPKLLGKDYEYIGIEVWEPYIKIFNLNEYYKEIIVADVSACTLPKGELIIFGDILEHLKKKPALKLIAEALKLYQHLIISIPVDGRESKIHYSNLHEAHISTWTYEEVKKLASWEFTLESRGIGVFIK